jgi:hypothetical protein
LALREYLDGLAVGVLAGASVASGGFFGATFGGTTYILQTQKPSTVRVRASLQAYGLFR